MMGPRRILGKVSKFEGIHTMSGVMLPMGRLRAALCQDTNVSVRGTHVAATAPRFTF